MYQIFRGLYIEQCLPKSAITYITELNETIPINVSASGKILTALLPAKEQSRFLQKTAQHFEKNTEKTLLDLELLQEHLSLTAQRGYGTDDEEYAMGVGCIAVPIYDSEGKPLAAIGTTGPVEVYHQEDEFQSILEFLKKIAQDISDRIS